MKSRLPSFFFRRTASDFFIPEVDGFRFFAIFTVVFFHLNTHFIRVISSSTSDSNYSKSLINVIMSEGGVGVNVFFTISGFILALPFARQWLFSVGKVNLRQYYIRRLTRLEPPYVISLIILLIAQVIITNQEMTHQLLHFLASTFYVHNIIFNEWSTINPVAWSLEVEVQFYLLAPFMASVFVVPNIYIRRSLIGLIIILSILHHNFNYDWIAQWHLRKSLFMHLHEFFIGFLMADIFLVDWKGEKPSSSWMYDIFGILSIVALFVWNAPFDLMDDFIFDCAALLLFVCLFKGRALNFFFSRPIIVSIGGMCYSIYLLHYAIIAFISNYTKSFFVYDWGYTVNFWIQAGIVIPLVLFISILFFVLIERPCMDKEWPRKLKAKMISIFTK